MRHDQIINCSQCGQQFVFTQEEQQFYSQKGLEIPDKCMVCRASVREAKKDNFRGRIEQQ